MIAADLEAIITCVDTEQLDRSSVGRFFGAQLLEDVPDSVAPCAENGEFHSVGVAGPTFAQRLDVCVGKKVARPRFAFAEVALVVRPASLAPR